MMDQLDVIFDSSPDEHTFQEQMCGVGGQTLHGTVSYEIVA